MKDIKVTGRKYRVLKDKKAKIWKVISWWTDACDVEFADGRNVQDVFGGIRGIEELERRCTVDCKCAFAMYPTDIHELFAVADAGLLMPPKSTWFEPKLLSGLFIHDLM
jgi:uncharacterized protein (DUF1015 family)